MLRVLFGCFLVIVVVEGAIRKWILPEYSTIVFGVKDVLLVLAFAWYMSGHRESSARTQKLLIWVLWGAYVVGHAAVTGFPLASLIGLRYYLTPLLLINLVPALIRDSTDLERVSAWAVRVSFPIGLLATVQYLSPVDSPVNTYAWGADAISTFGSEEADVGSGVSRARVTSTFSYISTYASFLTGAWLLAWISALHGRTQLDRRLAVLALILIAFNMGMNGSRSLLLVAAITGLPFFWALVRRIGVLRTPLLGVGVAIVIGYVGISVFEPFLLTVARGGDEEAIRRVTGALLTPFATLSSIDFFGAGIGGTFGGFEQIGQRNLIEGFDEVNVDRVGIELGVPGYLLLLVIKLLMVAKAYGVYRHLPAGPLRRWALMALLTQLSAVWQIPFYNSVAAIIYFSSIGLVYWLEGEQRRLRTVARLRPSRDGQARVVVPQGSR